MPEFIMCHKIIEPKLQVLYLGLILHYRMNFTAHVKAIKAKVTKIIGVLYCLISRRSKLSIKNKTIVYNVIIKALML